MQSAAAPHSIIDGIITPLGILIMFDNKTDLVDYDTLDQPNNYIDTKKLNYTSENEKKAKRQKRESKNKKDMD